MMRGVASERASECARGRRRDKRERRSTIDERVGRQTPSCRDLLLPRSDRRRHRRRRCRRHHRRGGSPLKSARPSSSTLSHPLSPILLLLLLRRRRHSSRPSDALPSDHLTLTHLLPPYRRGCNSPPHGSALAAYTFT